MDEKKRLYIISGVVVAVCLVVIIAVSSMAGVGPIRDSAPETQQAAEAQVVMLGLGRQGYEPAEITVEANKPVTLRNDGTLQGCAMYPVQPELGLRGDFAKSDEATFTPTKKGKFTYTCSMGMWKGVINVV